MIKDIPLDCLDQFVKGLVKNRTFRGELVIDAKVVPSRAGYAVILTTSKRTEMMGLTDFLKAMF